MKERKAYRIVLLKVKCNITNEKVNPLMGRLHLYILIGLVLLVTKLCISNSPPQVGRCSKHFQLEMRKYKEMHQANENTRKDAGNTSAKKKQSHQTSAYPTRSNHNSRLNQLKEGASKQRLTTIRQKPISTKPIKAQRLTIKSVQSLKIEAQDKKYKDIQKSMMISKKKCKEEPQSTMEGGHIQDQGSKDKKMMPSNAESRQEKNQMQGRAIVNNGRRSYVEQTSHQRYYEATRPRFQR